MTIDLRQPIAIILALALGLGAAASARAQTEVAAITPSAFAPIATTVDSEIAAGHVPGAVVIVGEKGRIIYRRAFGARALVPNRVEMSPDTIFDLASLTKVVVTTTAVMQLVEAKRLRLSEKVAAYWPAFAANGKGAITVEQLLTHTSGLRPDLDGGTWSGEASGLTRVAAERPTHAPGTRFVYSDINFITLGALVERISGESLDAYAQRHIFAPLEMKDSGFRPAAVLRARIAPADIEEGKLRWGEVQDPTAWRMGGVAGHAGVFSTADDLAKFAQMLLDGGRAPNGRRVLSPASVAQMTAPHPLPGGFARGLGWDIDSPYAGSFDAAFGPGSYGHTGFTGTSLWIDPKARRFLIILTNRLHPEGGGAVKTLRARLASIVATSAPVAAVPAAAPAAATPSVRAGIDVLEARNFAPLAGLRIGLITNETGRDAAGRRTIDLLAQAPQVHLTAIFSPEHGLGADREGRIDSGVEPVTGIPVYSLYGKTKRPSEEVLAKLDALVVDIQDVGVRFYTYATTMAYAMEAAARAGLHVYVLDRPNPISAAVVQGPVLDDDLRSFTSYFPLPLRHGMTMGELATLFNGESRIGAKLTVVRMEGYRRGEWYDETGLPWVNPSPNLRSLEETALYPGVALVEGANVSVGRGTAQPFKLVGAPWIDGVALAKYLQQRAIPGVRFSAADFTPSQDSYAGKLCHGVAIALTDREQLDAPRLGIELAAALHRLYPERFTPLNHLLGLIGSRKVLAAISGGADPRGLPATWQADLAAFQTVRSKYLLYP